MEFKRVQFLKKEMKQKLGKDHPSLDEQDVFSLDALTLAYLGDACWSFFIRNRLIDTGIHHVQILNSLASEMVSAKWQSRILFEISSLLNDRELKVCKRGRNTKSTVPKSATVEEYRESTAFEALLGYLYLSGNEERLSFIMRRSLQYVSEEMGYDQE
ncbi:MAG: ribonuclease III domain-containing protein [Dialister sp.]|nr:ribonuclease III domain-containing protein [Dialister sp.]